MLIVGKPPLMISDRWKLPLPDCLSDYSYASSYQKSTNCNPILHIFQGGFSLQELISLSSLQNECRIHPFLRFHVTWIRPHFSFCLHLARWPSAKRNLTCSSSLLSSACCNSDGEPLSSPLWCFSSKTRHFLRILLDGGWETEIMIV